MQKLGTGAANLDITFRIGAARVLTCTFRTLNTTTGLYTDEDISGKTFSFTVWRNPGDRLNRFNLTNNNGITVPIYSTNQIRISVSAINATQEEGEYYYELRRTDLNAPKMSGNAYFTFRSPQ